MFVSVRSRTLEMMKRRKKRENEGNICVARDVYIPRLKSNAKLGARAKGFRKHQKNLKNFPWLNKQSKREVFWVNNWNKFFFRDSLHHPRPLSVWFSFDFTLKAALEAGFFSSTPQIVIYCTRLSGSWRPWARGWVEWRGKVRKVDQKWLKWNLLLLLPRLTFYNSQRKEFICRRVLGARKSSSRTHWLNHVLWP